MASAARERIILPLDVATEEEALSLVLQLREHVGFFKIGLELLSSVGVGVVKRVSELGGDVFLDAKLHDIPNTVAGASKAMTRLAVRMFNVHTMGGFDMMTAAVKAVESEASARGSGRPLVLGVTILTSIDQEALTRELRITGDIEAQVVHLAGLAVKAGLDGIIASPNEIEAIRQSLPGDTLIVTPGVRPDWAAAQDQKRIMTPREAILKGASYVVVGRPITAPPPGIGSPVDAAKRIADEIASALEAKEG